MTPRSTRSPRDRGAGRRLALLLVGCVLGAALGCPAGPGPGASPSPSGSPAPSLAPLASPSAVERGGRRRVALLIPHEDLFWKDFQEFMAAAAQQLELDLEVHLAGNNRERMKEQLRAATSGPRPVDAVVFQNFKQVGPDLLALADAGGVPAFVVNAGVEESECGAPRARYPRWLGTMVPDDRRAGQDLAELLVAEAKAASRVAPDGRVHLIGLGGFVSDTSSSDRVAGLERALAGRADVSLDQVVPTDWSREEGRLKAAALLGRFPTTTVVWTASDALALGAIDALRELGRAPGREVLVGGVDWTAEALEAIERGELSVTIGGHFMEGGWVAVLLHDYFAGRDFGARRVTFATPMRPIGRAEAARLRATITAARWGELDFRALCAPSGEQGYEFDALEALRGLGR